MKILAIYKYYWPDTTPYARILKAILEYWVNEGHEVKVLTAQPGYNDIVHPPQPQREIVGGVSVRRDWIIREVKASKVRRLLSFLNFLGRAIWRACSRQNVDVIIVNLHPPVLMGLAVRLIKRLRGIPYIYHCVDIHPESALCVGDVSSGFLYRMLRWIDTANCRNAALVVTLSVDMVGTLLERGIPRDKIVIINNFITVQDDISLVQKPVLPSTMNIQDGDFVIVFGGNIGRFQGLDHIIYSARLLSDRPDIKFLFMGEGTAKAGLVELAGDLRDKTVFFSPYMEMSVAKQVLVESDIALVPLGVGVYKVAYPSKTMNCLAAGCPILAIVEDGSSLARDVIDSGLGICCRQGEYEETAHAIREACRRKDEWRASRPTIASWAEANFSQHKILPRWGDVLAQIKAQTEHDNE
jgi:colanic acid biosynthesis glycosyl transferase WcaI